MEGREAAQYASASPYDAPAPRWYFFREL